MQTIGERLEEARKRKGISIREAAETTKIRSDYLQKFEANSFDLDLPPLYIRGFMRSYARYLDLDQERFIAEYDSVAAAEGRGPRRAESRENYGRVEFAEGGGEAPAGKRSSVDQAMLIKYGLFGGAAIAVIVVLILIINYFVSSPSTKPAQTAGSTPSSASNQSPADNTQTLTLTATDNTRVKVVLSGENRVLFDGALAPGETKSIKKQGILRITVEDRTKVRVEVNGKNITIPRLKYGDYGWFDVD